MDSLHFNDKATVLVVDDTPDNLALMSALLKNTYKVKVANHGDKGLRIAASATPPDLILLDVMMPDVDGYEVCRRLKADSRTCNIPVIFLTARSEPEDEHKGLALGAADYITKPISPPILLARVATQLTLKASSDFLRDQNDFLTAEVERRTRELEAVQDVTILALASLAETRDAETGKHILRTQRYVKVLAEKLRTHPRFSNFLTERNIKTLFKSAPLHDIGKVGIPDRILLKPGRYEPHELEIMKNHTLLGRDAIQLAEDWLGAQVEFLTIAKEIALCHQEKWDGSGYPDSLVGDSIPVSARLMAIADVYDALISRRVYKERLSHERAAQIIVEGRGSHFDPDMVDAFIEIQEEFREIAQLYPDSDGDFQKKIEFLAQALADQA
ncbi:MAG: Cyclic di-GMP phosphodiesterase response regulator RpfG [Candidatus Accumulibacter appositus]|uniref:Cyclic di-GMP phosphodiesterase response regulator RpfG n=1 Tax=Candidatus Accumulibacter appositus TaxID=1454003 RepID=A0A011QGL6_9PROT|nr:two-component system response regulator [Accumulibacter sp.]EXI77959.1 MAG: Cyclic di-GMP phosphodiesterase response regulator RpfG [Candidatus Accumulibacter appositus]HRF06426.1 two-component system response regulator [Accumulibacter sp.]